MQLWLEEEEVGGHVVGRVALLAHRVFGMRESCHRIIVVVSVAVSAYIRIFGREQNDRHDKTLVVHALIKLLDAVDAAHGTGVAKRNPVQADMHNRTVGIKEVLDGETLRYADDVGGNPEVGDGSIPEARNGGKGLRKGQ